MNRNERRAQDRRLLEIGRSFDALPDPLKSATLAVASCFVHEMDVLHCAVCGRLLVGELRICFELDESRRELLLRFLCAADAEDEQAVEGWRERVLN